MSLLQVLLVVLPSLGHQDSLQGGTLHTLSISSPHVGAVIEIVWLNPYFNCNHKTCFNSGMSLLQVRLVVFLSLGHQDSLQGGTLHEHPFH